MSVMNSFVNVEDESSECSIEDIVLSAASLTGTFEKEGVKPSEVTIKEEEEDVLSTEEPCVDSDDMVFYLTDVSSSKTNDFDDGDIMPIFQIDNFILEDEVNSEEEDIIQLNAKIISDFIRSENDNESEYDFDGFSIASDNSFEGFNITESELSSSESDTEFMDHDFDGFNSFIAQKNYSSTKYKIKEEDSIGKWCDSANCSISWLETGKASKFPIKVNNGMVFELNEFAKKIAWESEYVAEWILRLRGFHNTKGTEEDMQKIHQIVKRRKLCSVTFIGKNLRNSKIYEFDKQIFQLPSIQDVEKNKENFIEYDAVQWPNEILPVNSNMIEISIKDNSVTKNSNNSITKENITFKKVCKHKTVKTKTHVTDLEILQKHYELQSSNQKTPANIKRRHNLSMNPLSINIKKDKEIQSKNIQSFKSGNLTSSTPIKECIPTRLRTRSSTSLSPPLKNKVLQKFERRESLRSDKSPKKFESLDNYKNQKQVSKDKSKDDINVKNSNSPKQSTTDYKLLEISKFNNSKTNIDESVETLKSNYTPKTSNILSPKKNCSEDKNQNEITLERITDVAARNLEQLNNTYLKMFSKSFEDSMKSSITPPKTDIISQSFRFDITNNFIGDYCQANQLDVNLLNSEAALPSSIITNGMVYELYHFYKENNASLTSLVKDMFRLKGEQYDKRKVITIMTKLHSTVKLNWNKNLSMNPDMPFEEFTLKPLFTDETVSISKPLSADESTILETPRILPSESDDVKLYTNQKSTGNSSTKKSATKEKVNIEASDCSSITKEERPLTRNLSTKEDKPFTRNSTSKENTPSTRNKSICLDESVSKRTTRRLSFRSEETKLDDSKKHFDKPATRNSAPKENTDRPSTRNSASKENTDRPSTRNSASKENTDRPSTRNSAPNENTDRPSTRNSAPNENTDRQSTKNLSEKDLTSKEANAVLKPENKRKEKRKAEDLESKRKITKVRRRSKNISMPLPLSRNNDDMVDEHDLEEENGAFDLNSTKGKVGKITRGDIVYLYTRWLKKKMEGAETVFVTDLSNDVDKLMVERKIQKVRIPVGTLMSSSVKLFEEFRSLSKSDMPEARQYLLQDWMEDINNFSENGEKNSSSSSPAQSLVCDEESNSENILQTEMQSKENLNEKDKNIQSKENSNEKDKSKFLNAEKNVQCLNETNKNCNEKTIRKIIGYRDLQKGKQTFREFQVKWNESKEISWIDENTIKDNKRYLISDFFEALAHKKSKQPLKQSYKDREVPSITSLDSNKKEFYNNFIKNLDRNLVNYSLEIVREMPRRVRVTKADIMQVYDKWRQNNKLRQMDGHQSSNIQKLYDSVKILMLEKKVRNFNTSCLVDTCFRISLMRDKLIGKELDKYMQSDFLELMEASAKHHSWLKSEREGIDLTDDEDGDDELYKAQLENFHLASLLNEFKDTNLLEKKIDEFYKIEDKSKKQVEYSQESYANIINMGVSEQCLDTIIELAS